MKHPRLSAVLLRWAAPPAWLEPLAGDLEEECSGKDRAWYRRQVLRSVPPLVGSRLRSMNWQVSLFAILIGSAGQIAGIDLAWSWLLSQVPLKAGAFRGGGYLAVALAVTLLSASLAGRFVSLPGLALAIPAISFFTLLGVAAMRGITPAWFGAAEVFAAVLGLWSGSVVWRRAS